MLLFLIDPQTTEQLIKFYFSWIIILFLFHVLIDKYSAHTSDHNWKLLKGKVSELYTSASVASSLLLGLMILHGFKNHPLFDSDIILMPLILSALTGIVVGLDALVPKPREL
ncbi:hypothetical protein [Psychromonas sp. Urea-02u-13]|uniref:hypothetical protein n=1 Tax=Psychromonas sp. Urea-02u-13 TaxID=2058326 RepID=UPI000C339395|nr:hypothetical protein [Psychromonas sp. Urea-02u-13]PKG40594.1 hypothetical protein CXF74_03110 [Psychromonas sp. Urea-02u-13]